MGSDLHEVGTLGGGCFWCLDSVFRDLRGVERVECGYAGGSAMNPTYEDVCTGLTGHAEVVRVAFDPEVVPYEDLLRVFFSIHDPTMLNRQGHDVGTQYRSIILYHTPEQRAAAEHVIHEIGASKLWDDPIVTQVVPLKAFCVAEEVHQDYFARNPEKGYCRAVIAPKVAKFRKEWRDRLRR